MEQFDQLLAILDRLIGPGGCPWDQQQTMETLRETVLEEACEVIDAINMGDNEHIIEELGDLLLNVVFLCKIAEKENRFQTEKMIHILNEKLIRRHPHVFENAKVNGIDELWKQWDSIKVQEKGKDKRKSVLDGIPKGLPALAYASKIVKKIKKTKYVELPQVSSNAQLDEEAVGKELFDLILRAQSQGIDAEQALRKIVSQQEGIFRAWEGDERKMGEEGK